MSLAAISPTAGPVTPGGRPDETQLRALAQELEARFLAEMLKHADFGAGRETLGGGPGEEQFASMLRDEHAGALAARGGIGLAEALFQALAERAEDGPGPSP